MDGFLSLLKCKTTSTVLDWRYGMALKIQSFSISACHDPDNNKRIQGRNNKRNKNYTQRFHCINH
jgi:hypothetical protein